MSGFYLQNTDAKLGTRITWWGDGGYTTNLDLAKVFTQADVAAQHQEREAFVPWSAEYVYPKAHTAVDCQCVSEQDLAILSAETPCYVQLKGNWDGNDLYWETCEGTFDVNLDRAQVFRLDDAMTRYGSVDRAYARTIWPKSYIDTKTRKIANCNSMNVSDALAGTGIVLTKRLIKKERLTCCGCRRFLSEVQFWTGACSNCGTFNRP